MAITSENTSIFGSMRYYHYIELLFPLYLIINPIIISVTSPYFGVDLRALFSWYIILVIFVGTFGIITYTMYGKNDFRFKLYFHFAVLGSSVGVTHLLVPASGLFELFSSDRIMPVGQILLNIALIFLPLALVIFGALMGGYDLATPFVNEIENMTNAVGDNSYQYNVENTSLLSDKVFGPPLKLMDKALTSLSESAVKTRHTISIAKSTSESLLSATEEINASSEEVASTSQSMSQGASQQAEMIFEVVNNIRETDILIGEIINSIQNNADTVSQIALQTNILALNAGIEASRAGDYGRGFAVVAENVRRLSEESKLSADQINQVVASISENLKNLFAQISDSVEAVASVSEETAASAEEVAAAAEEMTASLEEISTQTNNLFNIVLTSESN